MFGSCGTSLSGLLSVFGDHSLKQSHATQVLQGNAVQVQPISVALLFRVCFLNQILLVSLFVLLFCIESLRSPAEEGKGKQSAEPDVQPLIQLQ